jgi:hypothetical protein
VPKLMRNRLRSSWSMGRSWSPRSSAAWGTCRRSTPTAPRAACAERRHAPPRQRRDGHMQQGTCRTAYRQRCAYQSTPGVQPFARAKSARGSPRHRGAAARAPDRGRREDVAGRVIDRLDGKRLRPFDAKMSHASLSNSGAHLHEAVKTPPPGPWAGPPIGVEHDVDEP